MSREGERPEVLDMGLVRSYIIAAHGNFEEVQELVALEPGLVNAVINWGGDDWESGVGAAAHTGNRDIVLWLLERGARMDIYTAAMLGELEIVKSILAVQPEAIHAKGPHGIPLIHHARMGKEAAIDVLEYLEKIMEMERV